MNKKTMFSIVALGSLATMGTFLYKHTKKEENKDYVLITGASSGIGYELAKLFAQDGYPLILVARNQERLEQVKEELVRYTNQIECIPCDLSKEDSAKILYQTIRNNGWIVSTLIDNAGAGKSGELIETDEQTSLDLIHLNISSLTLLAQTFGKDMAQRKRGNILIVASTAAFGPDAGLNIYGPTKAYAYNFAQTLRAELSSKKVNVSCLCPGPTKTNWSKNAGRQDSKWAMEVEEVARTAYLGLQEKRALIIPGSMNKVLYGMSKVVPDAAIGKVTSLFQKSLKK